MIQTSWRVMFDDLQMCWSWSWGKV